MIYAVDFDGTLCTNAWPDIGEPNIAFIRHFRELREQGHRLILWTCREGEALQRAIDWCADYGLGFDAHNENLPELNELYGNDCRKVGADFYVDDKSYWPIGKESKMNADEVVSALRCCNRSKGHRCSVCPVFSRYEHRICKATVDRFAADLIESLQAQLTERDMEIERLRKEVASLAIESVKRDVELARLEAEVMQLWEAQECDPQNSKKGEPK